MVVVSSRKKLAHDVLDMKSLLQRSVFFFFFFFFFNILVICFVTGHYLPLPFSKGYRL